MKKIRGLWYYIFKHIERNYIYFLKFIILHPQLPYVEEIYWVVKKSYNFL